MLMIWLAGSAVAGLARHRRNAIVSPITWPAASKRPQKGLARSAMLRRGLGKVATRALTGETARYQISLRAAARSLILLPCKLSGARARCERRDSNPHGGYPSEPKSGASTNSATFAGPRAIVSMRRAGHKKKRLAARPGLHELVGLKDPKLRPTRAGRNKLEGEYCRG